MTGAEPPGKRLRTSVLPTANQNSSFSADDTMIVAFKQNITQNILAEPQKVGVLTRSYSRERRVTWPQMSALSQDSTRQMKNRFQLHQ